MSCRFMYYPPTTGLLHWLLYKHKRIQVLWFKWISNLFLIFLFLSFLNLVLSCFLCLFTFGYMLYIFPSLNINRKHGWKIRSFLWISNRVKLFKNHSAPSFKIVHIPLLRKWHECSLLPFFPLDYKIFHFSLP